MYRIENSPPLKNFPLFHPINFSFHSLVSLFFPFFLSSSLLRLPFTSRPRFQILRIIVQQRVKAGSLAVSRLCAVAASFHREQSRPGSANVQKLFHCLEPRQTRLVPGNCAFERRERSELTLLYNQSLAEEETGS